MWNDTIQSNPELTKNTSHFIVQRVVYDSSIFNITNLKSLKGKLKNLGKLKPISSEKELKKVFPNFTKKSMTEELGIKDSIDLWEYLGAGESIDYYGLPYILTEFQMALGHVFLDENIKAGETYLYLVSRVEKNGNKHNWGRAIVQSGLGNYWINSLKPKVSSNFSTDSVIMATWKLPIPSDVYSSVKLPKNSSSFPELNEYFHRMPFEASNVMGIVTTRIEGSQKKVTQSVMPSLNETEDTLTFSVVQDMLPEQGLIAYLTLEDPVHNTGINSDTFYQIAVSHNNLPILTSLRSQVITDGLRISWDEVSQKSYVMGIEIKRRDSVGSKERVIILSPNDTSYTDYQVLPGITYEYYAKTVFFPSVNKIQQVPATTVLTPTKFSRPIAPYNLVASPVGDYIKIEWEYIDNNSIFGFNIYRSDYKGEMEYIKGPVDGNSYIDSAKTLNGKSKYYYSVVAVSLTQDKSHPSDTVSSIPTKQIETNPPGTMNFYLTNRTLSIRWQDTREINNAIRGFILERRTSKSDSFMPVQSLTIPKASYIDTAFKSGVKYEFRVANVDYKGDKSEFSDVFTYTYKDVKSVGIISIFYVVNTTKGIEIRLPEVEYGGRKSIVIHRRLAKDETFEEIGSIPNGTTKFLDSNVKVDERYVYALQIVSTDDVKGAIGSSKSIKRKKIVLE